MALLIAHRFPERWTKTERRKRQSSAGSHSPHHPPGTGTGTHVLLNQRRAPRHSRIQACSSHFENGSRRTINYSIALYGRCQASSRPHARFRKGESRRTWSEPFSPFESKPGMIHTCKEYPGAQLRSARCCSSRFAQKEDRKCNLRNLKS